MANWLLIGPRGSRRIGWLQRALHDQGAPAAHEQLFNGAGAHAHHLRDGGHIKVGDGAQQQRHSLPLRQARKTVANKRKFLPCSDPRIGTRVLVGQHILHIFEADEDAKGTSPVRVDAAVCRDPVEPCRGASLRRIETRCVLPDRHEHILHDILRVGGAAEIPGSEEAKATTVAVDKARQRALIARGDTGEKFGILAKFTPLVIAGISRAAHATSISNDGGHRRWCSRAAR